MMKSFAGNCIKSLIVLLAAGCSAGSDTEKSEQQIARAHNTKQEVLKKAAAQSYEGPAEYFTGKVSVTPIFDKNPTTESATGAFVTFEPGARSHWHIHPKGQILVIVDGVGYTQSENGSIQEVGIGDTIVCPPNVKHWHGASPDSYMTHFVITGELDGKNVQWLEPVADDEYYASKDTQ